MAVRDERRSCDERPTQLRSRVAPLFIAGQIVRRAVGRIVFVAALAVVCGVTALATAAEPEHAPLALPYCIVDTGQRHLFSDVGQIRQQLKPDQPFFGQDAQYQSHPLSYSRSSDGLTVYDNHTGLTWQRSPDINGDGKLDRSDKLTLAQARQRPAALNAAGFGGFRDWRLPGIKELYSLIDFRGIDPGGPSGTDTTGLRPFLDSTLFEFAYGSSPERIIDSQYASSTLYVNKTWRGFEKLFGVNFADGRIKGYDLLMPGGMQQKTFFVQCVRGNVDYGTNKFTGEDGVVVDRATGLMWSKADSGKGMDWQAALAWVQTRNREKYLGHDDWRLPSAKELQSIVDYTRSPDTTNSAAIDPLFACTPIKNEAGQADYPCYWTATTHGSSVGRAAVYISFGRSLGYMMGEWHDVHGAGSQRSDPKSGDPAEFPHGRGPQGDAIRILNFVRPVRNIDPKSIRLVDADLTQLAFPRRGNRPSEMADGMGAGPAAGPEPGGAPAGGVHLVPPFAADRMNLSQVQQRQIAELEQTTRARLSKILTPAQMKILDESRPPRFGPQGPFGPGPGPAMPGGPPMPGGGPPFGP